jgi:hypothetical protein
MTGLASKAVAAAALHMSIAERRKRRERRTRLVTKTAGTTAEVSAAFRCELLGIQMLQFIVTGIIVGIKQRHWCRTLE